MSVFFVFTFFMFSFEKNSFLYHILKNFLSELKTEVKKESCVIIIPLASKYSLSGFLTSKTAKDQLPFSYQKAVKLLDWNINMAELERNHVMTLLM